MSYVFFLVIGFLLSEILRHVYPDLSTKISHQVGRAVSFVKLHVLGGKNAA